MNPTQPPDTVIQQDVPHNERPAFFKIGKLIVILVSYVFIFFGFLCQLGGVGKANKKCEDDNIYDSCPDFFRYDWWVTWFQFLVVMGVAFALLFNILREVSMGVSILMAVSISQSIIVAEKYLDLRDEGSEHKAAAAGYIFATLGDILLALVIGVAEVPAIQFVDVSKMQDMMRGIQIWPRRQHQPHPQQQAMELGNAQMMQASGQPVLQPYPQPGMPSGVPHPSGFHDAMHQPADHQGYPSEVTSPQAQQPVLQQRYQNLSPHSQGQGRQFIPPPASPAAVYQTQPAHVVNP